MTHPTSLSFTADRISVPVKMDEERYVLLQADGAAATAYQDKVSECFKFDPETGKPISMANINATEIFLVHLCLYHTGENGGSNGKHVSQDIIRRWPSKVCKELFQTAIEISDLKAPEETASLFESALDSDEAPCSFEDLQEYIEGLAADNEKYEPLVKMLEANSVEKKVKN